MSSMSNLTNLSIATDMDKSLLSASQSRTRAHPCRIPAQQLGQLRPLPCQVLLVHTYKIPLQRSIHELRRLPPLGKFVRDRIQPAQSHVCCNWQA